MMSGLNAEDFRWFTREPPTLKALIERFPEEWVASDAQLKSLLAGGGASAVLEAAKSAQVHVERIVRSGVNPAVVKVSLPILLRARMMVLALKNYSLAAQTKTTGRVAFDEANARLLQDVLFDGPGLVRKPVDLAAYERAWAQVTQKSFLMPLVNKKGIYCFYTKSLIGELKALIGKRTCVELGAGDGTLSRFLHESEVDVRATDNQSWGAIIDYPAEVEKLDAAAALRKYRPQVALASWPDPDNAWEAAVFESQGLETYVVLGSAIEGVTGNHAVYRAQRDWTVEERPDLARLILPQEQQNAVLVFQRVT